jgi:hypothetical protein
LDDHGGKREQEIGSDCRRGGKAARRRHAAQVPVEHEKGDARAGPEQYGRAQDVERLDDEV